MRINKRFTKALKEYNEKAESIKKTIADLHAKVTIFCHLTKKNITLDMTTEDAEMALNMLYSDFKEDLSDPKNPVLSWDRTPEQTRFIMSFIPTDQDTLNTLHSFSKAWMFGRNEDGTKKNKTQSV